MVAWSRCAALSALLALSAGVRAGDGDLDASFGGSGEATAFAGTTAGGNVQVLAQADGQVVLVAIVSSGAAFGVTRLRANGATDTTFGSNGQLVVGVPSGGTALSAAAALDAAGDIVAGGTVDFGDHSAMFVMRLTSGGQLDPAFHGTGTLAIDRTLITAPGDRVAAIGVFSDPQTGTADDAILIAGSMQDTYGSFNARQLAVVPLHADGSYVTNPTIGNDTFFFGGLSDIARCYRTALPGGAGYDAAAALARRWFPNGSELIAVAGNAFSAGTTPDFGAVVELDGTLHAVASFGASGISEFIFTASGTAQANAVALDSSGRVLVAGIDTSTSHYNLGVARILGTGYYDTSFNGNGRVIVDFDESGGTYYSAAEALLVQHDGGILAGGQVLGASVGAHVQFGLVRLTAGGAADAAFTGGTTVSGARKYAFSAGNDFANSLSFTAGEKILLAGIVNQPSDASGVLRATNDRIFGAGLEPAAYLPRIP